MNRAHTVSVPSHKPPITVTNRDPQVSFPLFLYTAMLFLQSGAGQEWERTISQCVNKLLFIDFQWETLLTCLGLNGRHLLLALSLSLLVWKAVGRVLVMPRTACCSIVRRPIILQLSATTFTIRLAFVGYRR